MKATEDESKRSPTRRRLFGPVDHNQNKVDAGVIWTNINPGFPRVEYSPRFRPRPQVDRSTEARMSRERREDVEMDGDELEGGVVQMEESCVEEYRRDDAVQRSWNQNPGWTGSGDKATASNLSLGGGLESPTTGCSTDGNSTRRRRRVAEDDSTDDWCCDDETYLAAGSSYSVASTSSLDLSSFDPSSSSSCRSRRPATCPWRTLARTDEGRTRSASLGHSSRPSSSSRQRSLYAVDGSRRSPNFEPTYKTVPVVQLRGAAVTTLFCPPGQNYFFKPIGGGEESPALTASQSPDEAGDDESSSGGTRRSTVDSTRLHGPETMAADNQETLVLVDPCPHAPAVDICCLGHHEGRAAKEEVQQGQQQSIRRRRRQSIIDETDDSLGHEKDEEVEEEVAGHGCSCREEGNEDGRADRRDLSGRRIKDKLVTTPPKAKKRKPHEDGNSNSPC